MSNLTGFQAEALRLYGMSQDAIDKLDPAIPAAEQLVDLVTSAQPMIDEALALFAKAQPLLAQANGLLKVVEPAALALRAFMQTKSESTPAPPLPSNFG